MFLQVLLEVEGFPTGGLRAGEGFLVHMLVLLVVLPGEKTHQLPIPAPGHPTQAPQRSRKSQSLQALTFRYWRLEKIFPQPSKSHRRISRFAAFLTEKTWEKSLAGRRRRIGKVVGYGSGPCSFLLTHLPFFPPIKSKMKQINPFRASCLFPMEELSSFSSWECLETSLAPSLPLLSQVPDPLGADLSHILVAHPWSPPATAIGKSHLSQAVVSPRCPQAQRQETKRFPRKSQIKSSSGPAFLLFFPHGSRTCWNKHIVQALK